MNLKNKIKNITFIAVFIKLYKLKNKYELIFHINCFVGPIN
jgi:hypothetical protein